MVRGGSWNSNARNCRAAYRNAIHRENRNDNLGFRLARAQGPTESVRDPAPVPSPGFPGRIAERPVCP